MGVEPVLELAHGRLLQVRLEEVGVVAPVVGFDGGDAEGFVTSTGASLEIAGEDLEGNPADVDSGEVPVDTSFQPVEVEEHSEAVGQLDPQLTLFVVSGKDPLDQSLVTFVV